MPALLLYLLKANVAILLFYLVYRVALRRLTWYHLNRIFLLFSILFSAVCPLLDLNALLPQHAPTTASYLNNFPAWAPTGAYTATAAADFDYWQIPLYLFWIGVAVMLMRFALQLVSLYRIHAASEPARQNAVPYRKVRSISEAFSFWQTIYLNPAHHSATELEAILRHELIHIAGWHTLDVLLAEMALAYYWFNPAVWFLRKDLKENLEFIADQRVVNTGIDRKEYQYLLLSVVGATQPQIANQFNFPSLKRRIIMMNKTPNSKASQLRLLLVLPLITVLLFAFRSPAQPENPTPVAQAPQGDDIVYYIDGVKATKQAAEQLSPDAIHSMDVFKGDHAKKVPGNRAGKNVIVLTTKQNKDSEQVKKFQEKLPQRMSQGEVGMLPPPPPPLQDPGEKYIFILNEVAYYKDKANVPEDYRDFLKRNPNVKEIGWKFNNRQGSELESFVVYLKSGGAEEYAYNGNARIVAAEQKYGQLPMLPPPPPPVEIKKH